MVLGMSTSRLSKPRVLVVDDNYANRISLEGLLESEYLVDLAANGQQALSLALKQEYAVILLDVRMPEMDGFETAALLRTHLKTRETAIIFTSAYDQQDADVARGYHVGATDYLFSPVDPNLLQLKMRTYVSMHLRLKAMRLHLDQVTNILLSVQVELNKSGASEAALKARVRDLEKAIENLNREMLPVAPR